MRPQPINPLLAENPYLMEGISRAELASLFVPIIVGVYREQNDGPAYIRIGIPGFFSRSRVAHSPLKLYQPLLYSAPASMSLIVKLKPYMDRVAQFELPIRTVHTETVNYKIHRGGYVFVREYREIMQEKRKRIGGEEEEELLVANPSYFGVGGARKLAWATIRQLSRHLKAVWAIKQVSTGWEEMGEEYWFVCHRELGSKDLAEASMIIVQTAKSQETLRTGATLHLIERVRVSGRRTSLFGASSMKKIGMAVLGELRKLRDVKDVASYIGWNTWVTPSKRKDEWIIHYTIPRTLTRLPETGLSPEVRKIMKFIATKTISLTPTGLQGSDLLSKWKQHTGVKDAELWVRIDRTTDPSQFHPTIDYYPTDGEQKGPDMDWNFGDPETPPDEGPSPGGNTGGGSSRTRHEEEPEEEPEEEEPSTPPPGLGGARKKRTKERTPPKKPRARKNRPKTGPEAYRRTKVPGEEKEPSGQYGYEKRGGRTRGSPGARPRK